MVYGAVYVRRIQPNPARPHSKLEAAAVWLEPRGIVIAERWRCVESVQYAVVVGCWESVGHWLTPFRNVREHLGQDEKREAGS